MNPAGLPVSPDSASDKPRQTEDQFIDALRVWEPWRIPYNLVLATVVAAWLVLTWPHFRNALTVHSLLLVFVLAALANACYCAAYLLELFMQYLLLPKSRRRWRLRIWAAGTFLASVLACYWIADEIYPYVG